MHIYIYMFEVPGKVESRKNVWRNNGQNCLKFDENSQITRTSMNSSARNMKKNTHRHILIKLIKTSDKEKIIKAAWGKRYITYTETKIRWQQIYHHKQCNSEDSRARSLKRWKKTKLWPQNSLPSKNIFFKWRWNKDISYI